MRAFLHYVNIDVWPRNEPTTWAAVRRGLARRRSARLEAHRKALLAEKHKVPRRQQRQAPPNSPWPAESAHCGGVPLYKGALLRMPIEPSTIIRNTGVALPRATHAHLVPRPV